MISKKNTLKVSIRLLTDTGFHMKAVDVITELVQSNVYRNMPLKPSIEN